MAIWQSPYLETDRYVQEYQAWKQRHQAKIAAFRQSSKETVQPLYAPSPRYILARSLKETPPMAPDDQQHPLSSSGELSPFASAFQKAVQRQEEQPRKKKVAKKKRTDSQNIPEGFSDPRVIHSPQMQNALDKHQENLVRAAHERALFDQDQKIQERLANIEQAYKKDEYALPNYQIQQVKDDLTHQEPRQGRITRYHLDTQHPSQRQPFTEEESEKNQNPHYKQKTDDYQTHLRRGLNMSNLPDRSKLSNAPIVQHALPSAYSIHPSWQQDQQKIEDALIRLQAFTDVLGGGKHPVHAALGLPLVQKAIKRGEISTEKVVRIAELIDAAANRGIPRDTILQEMDRMAGRAPASSATNQFKSRATSIDWSAYETRQARFEKMEQAETTIKASMAQMQEHAGLSDEQAKKLLHTQTDQQYNAMTTPSNVVVLSGVPGAGKTETTAKRVAYQAQQGHQVDAWTYLSPTHAGKGMLQQRITTNAPLMVSASGKQADWSDKHLKAIRQETHLPVGFHTPFSLAMSYLQRASIPQVDTQTGEQYHISPFEYGGFKKAGYTPLGDGAKSRRLQEETAQNLGDLMEDEKPYLDQVQRIYVQKLVDQHNVQGFSVNDLISHINTIKENHGFGTLYEDSFAKGKQEYEDKGNKVTTPNSFYYVYQSSLKLNPKNDGSGERFAVPGQTNRHYDLLDSLIMAKMSATQLTQDQQQGRVTGVPSLSGIVTDEFQNLPRVAIGMIAAMTNPKSQVIFAGDQGQKNIFNTYDLTKDVEHVFTQQNKHHAAGSQYALHELTGSKRLSPTNAAWANAVSSSPELAGKPRSPYIISAQNKDDWGIIPHILTTDTFQEADQHIIKHMMSDIGMNWSQIADNLRAQEQNPSHSIFTGATANPNQSTGVFMMHDRRDFFERHFKDVLTQELGENAAHKAFRQMYSDQNLPASGPAPTKFHALLTSQVMSNEFDNTYVDATRGGAWDTDAWLSQLFTMSTRARKKMTIAGSNQKVNKYSKWDNTPEQHDGIDYFPGALGLLQRFAENLIIQQGIPIEALENPIFQTLLSSQLLTNQQGLSPEQPENPEAMQQIVDFAKTVMAENMYQPTIDPDSGVVLKGNLDFEPGEGLPGTMRRESHRMTAGGLSGKYDMNPDYTKHEHVRELYRQLAEGGPAAMHRYGFSTIPDPAELLSRSSDFMKNLKQEEGKGADGKRHKANLQFSPHELYPAPTVFESELNDVFGSKGQAAKGDNLPDSTFWRDPISEQPYTFGRYQSQPQPLSPQEMFHHLQPTQQHLDRLVDILNSNPDLSVEQRKRLTQEVAPLRSFIQQQWNTVNTQDTQEQQQHTSFLLPIHSLEPSPMDRAQTAAKSILGHQLFQQHPEGQKLLQDQLSNAEIVYQVHKFLKSQEDMVNPFAIQREEKQQTQGQINALRHHLEHPAHPTSVQEKIYKRIQSIQSSRPSTSEEEEIRKDNLVKLRQKLGEVSGPTSTKREEVQQQILTLTEQKNKQEKAIQQHLQTARGQTDPQETQRRLLALRTYPDPQDIQQRLHVLRGNPDPQDIQRRLNVLRGQTNQKHIPAFLRGKSTQQEIQKAIQVVRGGPVQEDIQQRLQALKGQLHPQDIQRRIGVLHEQVQDIPETGTHSLSAVNASIEALTKKSASRAKIAPWQALQQAYSKMNSLQSESHLATSISDLITDPHHPDYNEKLAKDIWPRVYNQLTSTYGLKQPTMETINRVVSSIVSDPGLKAHPSPDQQKEWNDYFQEHGRLPDEAIPNPDPMKLAAWNDYLQTNYAPTRDEDEPRYEDGSIKEDWMTLKTQQNPPDPAYRRHLQKTNPQEYAALKQVLYARDPEHEGWQSVDASMMNIKKDYHNLPALAAMFADSNRYGFSQTQSYIAPVLKEIQNYAQRLQNPGDEHGGAGGIVDEDKGTWQSENHQFLPSGDSVTLQGYQQRLTDQLQRHEPDEFQRYGTYEEMEHRLATVKNLRAVINNKDLEESYAHYMNIMIHTVMGDHPTTREKGNRKGRAGQQPLDVIFEHQRNRLSSTGQYTLEGAANYYQALHDATIHMQKTGKLHRGKLDAVLRALGHNPQDSRFKGLKLLSSTQTFRNADDQLSLVRLAHEYPKLNTPTARKPINEFTRYPLRPGEEVQFIGQPITTKTRGEGLQKGLTEGTIGHLLAFPTINKNQAKDVSEGKIALEDLPPGVFGQSRFKGILNTLGLVPHKLQNFLADRYKQNFFNVHPDTQAGIPYLLKTQDGRYFPVHEQQIKPTRSIVNGGDDLRIIPPYTHVSPASVSAPPDVQTPSALGSLLQQLRTTPSLLSRLLSKHDDRPRRTALIPFQPASSTQPEKQSGRGAIPLPQPRRSAALFSQLLSLQQRQTAKEPALVPDEAQQSRALIPYIRHLPVTQKLQQPQEPAPTTITIPPLPLGQAHRIRPTQQIASSFSGAQRLLPAPFPRQTSPLKSIDPRLLTMTHPIPRPYFLRKIAIGGGGQYYSNKEQAQHITTLTPSPILHASDTSVFLHHILGMHLRHDRAQRQHANVSNTQSLTPAPTLLDGPEGDVSVDEYLQQLTHSVHQVVQPPPISDATQVVPANLSHPQGQTLYDPGTANGADEDEPAVQDYMLQLGMIIKNAQVNKDFPLLSPEQMAVVKSMQQHKIITGGAGGGKTATLVSAIMQQVAGHEITPKEMISLSPMKSGVAALNTAFGKYEHYMPPNIDDYSIPRAITFHSLAAKLLFSNAHFDKAAGETRYPMMEQLGMPHFRGHVLVEPNDEELEELSPEARLQAKREGQSHFLESEIAASGIPWSGSFHIGDAVKKIGEYKKQRGDENNTYQMAYEQGEKDLLKQHLTSQSAFVLYEQGMKRAGLIDYDEMIHLGGTALEKMSHYTDLPQRLQGKRQINMDEVQDLTHSSHRLIKNYKEVLEKSGQDTQIYTGLDQMQSLMQSMGGINLNQIMPTLKKWLGIDDHFSLTRNFRSDPNAIALSNALLRHKHLKGEAKSDPQVPTSRRIGPNPQFVLSKAQPTLYQHMFRNMLHTVGITPEQLAANVRADKHPMEDITWQKKTLTGDIITPDQTPAIMSTIRQQELFRHEAKQVLMRQGGLNEKEAKETLDQIFARKISDITADTEDDKKEEIQRQFPVIRIAAARSRMFLTPHIDVTRTGYWMNKGIDTTRSYLRNLYTSVSRVKKGGINTIYATNNPLNIRDQEAYLAHPEGFIHTHPNDLERGIVTLHGKSIQYNKDDNVNSFQSVYGRAVPHMFKGLLQEQQKELAFWAKQGLIDQPRRLPQSNTATPAPARTGAQRSSSPPPSSPPIQDEITPELRAFAKAHADEFLQYLRRPLAQSLSEPPQQDQTIALSPQSKGPDFSAILPRLKKEGIALEQFKAYHALATKNPAGKVSLEDAEKATQLQENSLRAIRNIYRNWKRGTPEGDPSGPSQPPSLPPQVSPSLPPPATKKIQGLDMSDPAIIHYIRAFTIMQNNPDVYYQRYLDPNNPQSRKKLDVIQKHYNEHMREFTERQSQWDGAEALYKEAYIRKAEQVLKFPSTPLKDSHLLDPVRQGLANAHPYFADFYKDHLAQKEQDLAPGPERHFNEGAVIKEATTVHNATFAEGGKPEAILPLEEIPKLLKTIQGNVAAPDFHQDYSQQYQAFKDLVKLGKQPVLDTGIRQGMQDILKQLSPMRKAFEQQNPGIGDELKKLFGPLQGGKTSLNIKDATIAISGKVSFNTTPTGMSSSPGSIPFSGMNIFSQISSKGGAPSSSSSVSSSPQTSSSPTRKKTGGKLSPAQLLKATDETEPEKPALTPFQQWNNSLSQAGHSVARIGSELQFIGQLSTTVTNQALQQGSDYRKATIPTGGAGASGTAGFFDFSQGTGSIDAYRRAQLPMYSDTQLAQGIQSLTGMTQTPFSQKQTLPSLTDMLGISALTGLDSQQVMSQMTGITGLTGSGPTATVTNVPKLSGMLTNLYGNNLTADNVGSTLSALTSILPTLQGLSVGSNNDQTAQAMSFFKLANNAGMTTNNLPTVTDLMGNMAQIGSNPNLQQQYQLGQLFGQQNLTNDTQLVNYQTQQHSNTEQLAQLGLQQNINGQGLSLPNLDIQISQAQISMDKAQLDMSGFQQQYNQAQYGAAVVQQQANQAQYGADVFQQQYNQAQFNESQYQQNALYGPIGADVSRTSYYNWQQNQLAAGHDSTNPEAATTFTPSQTFGLKNEEFYSGMEHQRSQLVLGRSPLLSDMSFQENLKNINQQEDFYKRELDLQNQQRAFTKDWQQRQLDVQNEMLTWQKKQLDVQTQMLGWQKQQLDKQAGILAIQQQQFGLEQEKASYQQQVDTLDNGYLKTQSDDLTALNKAMAGFLVNAGPVSGNTVTPAQIIQALANEKDKNGKPLSDTDLKQQIRSLGIPLNDQQTAFTLTRQLQKDGGNMTNITKQLNGSSDKQLNTDLQNIIKSGGFASSSQVASLATAFLKYGGTADNWNALITNTNNIDTHIEGLAKRLSGTGSTVQTLGTIANLVGPSLLGIASILNILGVLKAGGLLSLLAPTTAAGSVALPLTVAAASLFTGWSLYNKQETAANKGKTPLLSWETLQDIIGGPGVELGRDTHKYWDAWNDPKFAKQIGMDGPINWTKAAPGNISSTVSSWWNDLFGGGNKTKTPEPVSGKTSPIPWNPKDKGKPSAPKKNPLDPSQWASKPKITDPTGHGGGPNILTASFPLQNGSNTDSINGSNAASQNFLQRTGTFFTKTLPDGFMSHVWNPSGTFFTKTLPDGFMTHIWNPSGTFFTKTFPDFFSTWIGNPATHLFTKIIPDAFMTWIWNPAGTFFMKMLPTFILKTLPGLFMTYIWNPITFFITKVLPNSFMTYIWNPAGTFFMKMLPDFITKTLPTFLTTYIGQPFASMITGTEKGFQQNFWTPASTLFKGIGKGFQLYLWEPAVDFFTKTLPDFFIKTLPAKLSDMLKGLFSSGGSNPLSLLLQNILKGVGSAPGGTGSTPVGHPGFVTPHVNQEFGVINAQRGVHEGVDFAANQGTAIGEFIGGVVAKTGHYDWGGEVDVTLPNGLTERYIHLSGIGVKPGDKLRKGDFVGLSGGGTPESGLGWYSDGPHLHYQTDFGTYDNAISPWTVLAAYGDTNIMSDFGVAMKQIQEYFGGPGRGSATRGGMGQQERRTHLAEGGVAMTRMKAELAEREPEAVIPISKLTSVLQSTYQQTSSPQQQEATPAGNGTMPVGAMIAKIADTLEVHVHTSAQTLDAAAQDTLMAQLLDIFNTALSDYNGKL